MCRRIYKRDGATEADIGILTFCSLVLTEGAWSELKEIAERYGHLLPWQYGERRLWLWNVTNVANVLDRDRSSFNHFGGVSHPVFTADKLTDNPVFKLREDNYTAIYCTYTFRQLIENHNFTGLEFEALDVA
ncbi:hypothetical protein GNX18_03650 [Microbulbifer sp. SH-1]|uniref:imm11 family protein n=1 Tax=Microbulbifer sp. SH-1 TaxID=2681547 RepID=UPI00140EF55F|nr:DUF1629 domain-containing protein [Microbulbifer sp. SH-1]QIL88959.1 hypothetical protein GNX18_03650 [Microbulbifer sp. SH-1]